MQNHSLVFSFLLFSYNFSICISQNVSDFYCFTKIFKGLTSTNYHQSSNNIHILRTISLNLSKEYFHLPEIQLALTFYDLETLENLLMNIYSNVNCEEIKIFIQTETEHELIDIFKTIGLLEEHRLKMSNSHLTCTPYFLIIGPVSYNNSLSHLEMLLADSSLPTLTSKVYLTWPQIETNKNNQTYFINCVIYQYFSSWTQKTTKSIQFKSVELELIGNFIKTRSHFHGMMFTATANIDKKVNITSILESKQNLHWKDFFSTGFNEQVMGDLQQVFNFSLHLIPSLDFIKEPINGTWQTNSIGVLLRNGSADISIDQSSYVKFRAQYFTLIMPIFHVKINIYFQQPHISTVRNLFTQPFSTYLWCALAGKFILALLLVYMIRNFLQFFQSRRNLKNTSNNSLLCLTQELCRKDKELFRNGSCIVWLTSFIALQGWYEIPKKTFLRIIFLFGSICGLIIYTAYSANLVSLFATELKPINSLHEFIQSQIPLFIASETATLRALFGNSLRGGKPIQSIERETGIINTMKDFTMNNSPGSSSAFMTNSDLFYSIGRSLVPYATDDYICSRITEIPATTVPVVAGMVLPKNSTLKEFFNHRIIQMAETGLLTRTQKNYMHTCKPICDIHSRKKSIHELTLNDTISAFIIVIVGLFISMLVLTIENGRKFKGLMRN